MFLMTTSSLCFSLSALHILHTPYIYSKYSHGGYHSNVCPTETPKPAVNSTVQCTFDIICDSLRRFNSNDMCRASISSLFLTTHPSHYTRFVLSESRILFPAFPVNIFYSAHPKATMVISQCHSVQAFCFSSDSSALSAFGSSRRRKNHLKSQVSI